MVEKDNINEEMMDDVGPTQGQRIQMFLAIAVPGIAMLLFFLKIMFF